MPSSPPPDHTWKQPPASPSSAPSGRQERPHQALRLGVLGAGLLAILVAGSVVPFLRTGEASQTTSPTGAATYPATSAPAPTAVNTVAAPAPDRNRSVRAPLCPGGAGMPAIEVSPVEPALGNRWVLVTVHNCDDSVLTLANLPTITATKGNGEKFEVGRDRAQPLQQLRVPPQGSAYMAFHYIGGGSSDDPDGRVDRLDYAIPEIGTATVLEFTDLGDDSASDVRGWYATAQEAMR